MLIDAQLAGALEAIVGGDEGVAEVNDGLMSTAPATPNSRATAATESSSAPTRRQISRRARSVSDARTPISLDVSDHDPTRTLLSRQRQVGRERIRSSAV